MGRCRCSSSGVRSVPQAPLSGQARPFACDACMGASVFQHGAGAVACRHCTLPLTGQHTCPLSMGESEGSASLLSPWTVPCRPATGNLGLCVNIPSGPDPFRDPETRCCTLQLLRAATVCAPPSRQPAPGSAHACQPHTAAAARRQPLCAVGSRSALD